MVLRIPEKVLGFDLVELAKDCEEKSKSLERQLQEKAVTGDVLKFIELLKEYD